jgi:hypothetical protein
MKDRDGVCSIREVYQDSEGTMTSFSIDPAEAAANNEEELVSIITLMLEAAEQPFLLEGDFIPESGNGEIDFSFIREDETKYH